ncbi:PepSY domain-containing protein [Pelagerythrobacter rhizovicinus]|uniref:PepSY domain-containing protein n=1 Tax=Pelagerythrobacter rhizovicinus TaxID=2268576 RepID=A0A4Q2KQ14_9SPHN|nr:PepSY domain-containing protein [Pelagerythrobacter rhizovicinus]RXZ65361.1 hypothetical protein ETX26_00950 [Pelagerythrobacter rhizovicinus]
MSRVGSTLLLSLLAAACAGEPESPSDATAVNTSGKRDVPVAEVPAEVLAAARAEQGDFTIDEAEIETRDGRSYYDVGGTLADGTEIEFDVMQEEDGQWRVVETQRDIALSETPLPVRETLTGHDGAFSPTRIIESVQADGLVIYELYGPDGNDPQGRKLEIRWDGESADLLAREWEH